MTYNQFKSFKLPLWFYQNVNLKQKRLVQSASAFRISESSDKTSRPDKSFSEAHRYTLLKLYKVTECNW